MIEGMIEGYPKCSNHNVMARMMARITAAGLSNIILLHIAVTLASSHVMLLSYSY